MDPIDLQHLASEAGLDVELVAGDESVDLFSARLLRFAQLVATAERRACAFACRTVLVFDTADPAAAFVDAIHSRARAARLPSKP